MSIIDHSFADYTETEFQADLDALRQVMPRSVGFLRAELERCEERVRFYIRRAADAQAIPGCGKLAAECYALAESWNLKAEEAREELEEIEHG
jgi:hypothetical protein